MNLFPLLLAILIIAFFTGSDSLFYLAYALGGLALLSRLWMRRALAGLQSERCFPRRAFFGERVTVTLRVANRGRWPLLWLQVHESLPLDLHVPNFVRRVVSLAPGESTTIRYTLSCRKRGYYPLGPLHLRTGDFFGLAPEREATVAADTLIVYPKVVPLRHLGLPSQLPHGSLASRRRIFEDPSRFFGVRDYRPEDGLRRIHWKSSARADRLQVKRFQPAIALHTLVVLNLNADAYTPRTRLTAGEVGITVAASIAAHLVEQRQEVGLALLGGDRVTGWAGLQVIPPARGRAHLVRLLERLARAEVAPTLPLAEALPRTGADLGWGSTLVVITPGEEPRLLEALLQMRRQGFHLLLVATDPRAPFRRLQGQLERIQVPACWVTHEQEMEVWR